MKLNAPGKLIAICIIITGCLAYIICAMFVKSTPDTTPAWATLTLITGYLIGNGTGARKGQRTEGVWEPQE